MREHKHVEHEMTRLFKKGGKESTSGKRTPWWVILGGFIVGCFVPSVIEQLSKLF